jgi:hypothetical protein
MKGWGIRARVLFVALVPSSRFLPATAWHCNG